MRLEVLVRELEGVIEASASTCRVRAIFGEPVKLAMQTIVPVGAAFDTAAEIVPLGFIHELCGHVHFTAIDISPLLRLPASSDAVHANLIARVQTRLEELARPRRSKRAG